MRIITDHIRSSVMYGRAMASSPPTRAGAMCCAACCAAPPAMAACWGSDKALSWRRCAETVIQENEGAYPELREKREYIQKLISH